MIVSADSEQTVQTYIEGLLFDSNLAEAPAVTEEPVASVTKHLANTVAEPAEQASTDNDGQQGSASTQPFIRRFAAAQQRAQLRLDGARTNNVPQWAGKRFKCITFKVANLKLALPMSAISGLYPLDTATMQSDESVSERADADKSSKNEQAAAVDWLLGNIWLDRPQPGDDGQSLVSVIDTARMVMPERYSLSMREAYRSVLMINDCDWGFAVDAVGGEIELEPSKVRWRSSHTRREWLAGTVIDKMCAIVDVDVVNRHLLANQVLASNDANG